MRKLLLVLLLLALPAISWAGEYALIKGKGVEVCEEYGKNLNSFNPNWPMEYRKINSEFKDFSNPKWELRMYAIGRIKISDNLLERIDKFLWERDANPIYHVVINKWPKWRGTKKQFADAYKNYSFERNEMARASRDHLIANIDIDNDGTLEPVYLDHLDSSSGYVLLVLKTDYTDIDYEKTKLVMMHPSRKDAGWGEFRPMKAGDWGVNQHAEIPGLTLTEDSLHSAYYNVFLYKNRVYFDMWWSNHPDYKGKSPFDAGRLHVYAAEKDKGNEICTYKFVK